MIAAKKHAIARIAAVCALILAMVFHAAPGVHAQATLQDTSGTQALTLAWPASGAVEWLASQATTPGPGDEAAVLALLQAGRIPAGGDWAEGYTRKLTAQGVGGSRPDAAWQLLAASVAGADTSSALAQWVALVGDSTVSAASTEEARLALLVFGPGCVIPPSGGLVPATLANQLALVHNPDGGFGPGGLSDAVTTARVLQALAFYQSDPVVQSAVAGGLEWLRGQVSAYGGFDVDGAPSAAATAEVLLALTCMGEASLSEGATDLARALQVFQNEDGGFSQDPDSPPDAQLSALCTLALVAQARQQAGLSSVFMPAGGQPVPAITDPASTPDGSLAESTAQPGLAGLLPNISIPGMPWLTTPVLLGILAGVVVIIIVLAVLLGNRRSRAVRQKRRKLKKAAKERYRAEGKPVDVTAEMKKDTRDDTRKKHVKPKW